MKFYVGDEVWLRPGDWVDTYHLTATVIEIIPEDNNLGWNGHKLVDCYRLDGGTIYHKKWLKIRRSNHKYNYGYVQTNKYR